MDPRFQQQNDSSHSQNNPYYSSENQSGLSIYPTLPPVQNPQHSNYPAPQQPRFNLAQTGYVPPAEYINVQVLQNQEVENENLLLSNKLREFEQGLDTCFMKCYQVWLWLIIICSSMIVFKTFISLTTSTSQSDKYTTLNLVTFFYGCWSITQSAFGVLAVHQKSPVKAAIACIMMSLYLIPSFIAETIVIVWIRNYVPDKTDDAYHLWYAFMYSILFFVSVHILVHILVDLVGAFRVRKILLERAPVLEQLKRNEDSF